MSVIVCLAAQIRDALKSILGTEIGYKDIGATWFSTVPPNQYFYSFLK
jgi:hypothetical protein